MIIIIMKEHLILDAYAPDNKASTNQTSEEKTSDNTAS